MLRYLGFGLRRFGLHPHKPLARMNWEIFAIIAGSCTPVVGASEEKRLRASTLWVFPPGSAHGWESPKRTVAEVAVFHFGSVPSQLAAAVRERGHLELPLRPADCRRLRSLARTLEPDFREPNNFSNLIFQGALIELTLLALRKLPERREPLPAGHAKQIAESAKEWYAANLHDNPAIDDVARRVHVSPSTLRRIFSRALRERPLRVFARLRLEAAMRLMTETTLKLDTIATECGYSSTSDFCRAFKRGMSVTPSVWRRTILPGPRAAEQSQEE